MSQHCPDKVPFAMRRKRTGDQAPSGCSDPPPGSGTGAQHRPVEPLLCWALLALSPKCGGGPMGPRSTFWAGQG